MPAPGESTDGPGEPLQRSHQPGAPPGRVSISRLKSVHARGSSSLVNLSLYAAGLSGLWTAFGTTILPIQVGSIVENGGSTILGFTFDLDDKNGALGLVSLVGLAAAAIVQPIAGVLSDKRSGPGKRVPFLALGTLVMAVSVMFVGLTGTLIALVLVNVLVQGGGNFGQGAANGLIADHVSPGNKGRAAGALNFSRVVGAAILTGLVLLMMAQESDGGMSPWMITSLAVMAGAAMAGTLWTTTSLLGPGEPAGRPEPEVGVERQEDGTPADEGLVPQQTYFWFLLALTVVISGFSALQLYAFFYLEDVIGLENAAKGGLVILATTSIATGLTVLPAGRIADRIGRDPMIYAGGGLGVIATVSLMFAGSLWVVAIVGLMIGVVIGIFLTVSWALANDLVSKRHAARDLGYASIAVLIGSAASRISGVGVDRLNQAQDQLGYQVVLGAVAVCFVISVVIMTRLKTGHVSSSAVPEGAIAD